MAASALKAPFPYFGGKRQVAGLVWRYLGNPDNYIEPFFGSGAMLWLRPDPARIETINDLDCHVANFWRATQHAPEAVAAHADGPVNECDLHARHRYLVLSDDAAAFRQRMRTDPDYYDARTAGWWCWGLCCWIGGGWCAVPGETTAEMVCRAVHGRRPQRRPQLADAHVRGRGVHSNDSAGTCEARRAWLIDWFGRLRDRLRTVRVCCGDWRRVCGSESVTTRHGVTGVFLDPPYSAAANRCNKIYAQESGTVAHDVRAWCLERGGDQLMRIVLAGYADEGHEDLERHGWRCLAWQAHGGYGNRSAKGQRNRSRERLWVSPACLTQPSLFPEA